MFFHFGLLYSCYPVINIGREHKKVYHRITPPPESESDEEGIEYREIGKIEKKMNSPLYSSLSTEYSSTSISGNEEYEEVSRRYLHGPHFNYKYYPEKKFYKEEKKINFSESDFSLNTDDSSDLEMEYEFTEEMIKKFKDDFLKYQKITFPRKKRYKVVVRRNATEMWKASEQKKLYSESD